MKNTGSRDGDEIVRLYFSVKGSGRQRPHRELLAFGRVPLKEGETRRVALPFDRRLFGGYGRDGIYEPPRGEVTVWVDGCSGATRLGLISAPDGVEVVIRTAGDSPRR